MRQKTDFTFQALFKRVREKRLNIEDIYTLDKRVATELPISRLLNAVIVVQKNKIRHLINWLQIEQFAYANNQDILIFLAEYYRLKKDGRNLVWHELCFDAQGGEGNSTGPRLLFYCMEMPANLLAN